MKKILLLVIMLGATVICHSQVFLNNSEYIYGVGETDDEALISLSKSVQVSISSEQTYSVSERRGKIKEEYDKISSVSSSINLVSVSNCEVINGHYYRYINKVKYVLDRNEEYFVNIQEIERLLSNTTRIREKHEINLILGYYYSAYCAMNDPLAIAFLGHTALDKANYAKTMAETLYRSRKYGFLSTYWKEPSGYSIDVCSGYDIPDTAQPADLFGFEYLNNGKWENAFIYYDSILLSEGNKSYDDSDETRNKICIVRSSTPVMRYRILYECKEEGRLMKISVPEDWYFADFKTANMRCLR
jgi:hypothetical protein